MLVNQVIGALANERVKVVLDGVEFRDFSAEDRLQLAEQVVVATAPGDIEGRLVRRVPRRAPCAQVHQLPDDANGRTLMRCLVQHGVQRLTT